MKETKGYKGIISLGIAELNPSENEFYCNANFKTVVNDQVKKLTENFWLVIFASGCNRYSNGTDYKNESEYQTNVFTLDDACENSYKREANYMNSASEMSPGSFRPPPKIDFKYVFANSSFKQNITIYMTCIILLSLYICILIWARVMDYRDSHKMGLTIIPGLHTENYYYKITIFTGTRSLAGTDSKVNNPTLNLNKKFINYKAFC